MQKMQRKVKTLITMISPSSQVRKVLSEIEPYADIRFLGEHETIENYVEEIEVLYGNIEEKDFAKAKKTEMGTNQFYRSRTGYVSGISK